MFRSSYYFLFAFIGVLTLGLLFGSRDSVTKGALDRLYPDEAALAQLTSFRVANGDLVAQLTKRNDQWLVKNRDFYPADESKVLAFKRDLLAAKLLEAKTQRPENHDRLGVGTSGTTVSIEGAAFLVVGQSASGRAGRYVRFANENQVWLQSSQLSEVTANAGAWLSRDLLDIDPLSIRRIIIDHEGGRLSVSQAAGVVSVVGIEDSEFRHDGIEDSLVGMFENLQLNDVAPVDDIDFSTASKVSVVTRRADVNETMTLALTEQDGLFWLTFIEGAPGSLDASGRAFAISRLNYDNMTKQKQALIKP